jgi:hypothetical protein
MSGDRQAENMRNMSMNISTGVRNDVLQRVVKP